LRRINRSLCELDLLPPRLYLLLTSPLARALRRSSRDMTDLSLLFSSLSHILAPASFIPRLYARTNSPSPCRRPRHPLVDLSARFSPYQIILTTLTALYAVRHLDYIFGLGGELSFISDATLWSREGMAEEGDERRASLCDVEVEQGGALRWEMLASFPQGGQSGC
jgi:hypothetical protein